MPLRAKILDPAMGSKTRSFASATGDEIKELPGDEPNDVLFNTIYGLRTIELNRPKKLNSLDGSMARKIVPRLNEWSKSGLISAIVIKGSGRAFCAGGDVAALATQNQNGKEGQQASKDYFALEYKLDHMIATYNQPYVAFMDGITMGGGVGLSVHAPFRIATENTVFAMPESNIGFFPDVGASFFLPRMDGELGTYLALTSEQLKGVNVFYSGIATHYIHSTSLPDLEARLSELTFKDHKPLQERLQIINSTIEEFCTGLPHDQPAAAPVVGNVRTAIDYVFQPANTHPQEILDALTGLERSDNEMNAPQEIKDWAAKTRKTLLARSPLSVRVALKQLREGGSWSIAETFKREHAIASRFMEHPDFVEGVSALLIRKPKETPKWSASSFDEVSDKEVDDFFDVGKQEQPLTLLNGTDYRDYPHAWIGLPRESDVLQFVRQASESKNKEDVIKHFEAQTDGKMGVREKVGDVVDRRCVMGSTGLSLTRNN